VLLGERAAGFRHMRGHLCLQIGVRGLLLHAAIKEGVVTLADTQTTNSVVLVLSGQSPNSLWITPYARASVVHFSHETVAPVYVLMTVVFGATTTKNLFPRLREEVEAIGSIRSADIYLVLPRMKPPVARSSVPPEEFMCAVAAAVSSASLP